MSNEKGRNAQKREDKRNDRLKRLVGIDLCACGGGNKLKCDGECRKNHIKGNSVVECTAVYQIDGSLVGGGKSRRPKRTWRYGRQKDGDENQHAKQQRREKFERSR